MHELAITETIVETVREHVGEAKVASIRLIVGSLSGVVPEAVKFCFDVCAAGTSLEGARLEVEEVAARARCRSCAAELVLEDAIPLCGCGSADLLMLSGQELKIQEVEVV